MTERDAASSSVRAIAFHLPQFHPIPENDRWWGAGFTEWTNVTRARPQFRRTPSAASARPTWASTTCASPRRARSRRRWRARTASTASATTTTGSPARGCSSARSRRCARRASPTSRICFCWANENWTRRWDGADHEILIAQNPSRARRRAPYPRPAAALPRSALHPRRRQAAAHRLSGRRAAGRARERATSGATCAGAKGSATSTSARRRPTTPPIPTRYGFDAVVEFPPHGVRTPPSTRRSRCINPDFDGRSSTTASSSSTALARPDPAWRVHRTVMPAWDNTARRPITR